MPVSQPPILINGAYRDCFNIINHKIGPFEYTAPARKYLVLRNSVFGSTNIRIFKSLDGGVTWGAGVDTANEPPNSGGYDVTEQNGVIHVIYQPNAGGGVRYISFNTTTDQWSSIVTGGPSPLITFRSVISSTGVIAVIYPVLSGSATYLRYVFFSAGAFGSPADFTTNTAFVVDRLQNAMIDSADLIHVWYITADGNTSFNSYNHNTLTLGGVVGVVTAIINHPGGIFNISTGVCSEWIDNGVHKLVAPNFTVTNNPQVAAAYISDNLTGTNWSLVTFDLTPAVSSGGDDVEVFSLTDSTGTILYVFWIALDYSDPLNVIDRLYYAADDGSGVSQPVLMYDAVTNPELEDPTIDPTDQDLHTLSVSFLSAGNFGIYTALEQNGLCSGYYLLDENCAILFSPAAVSGIVTLPAMSGAYYSTPFLAYEVGGETFEYTFTSAPPGDLAMQTTSGTERTVTGPIIVDDGIVIAGEPVYSEYQTPVTTTWGGHVRLVE